jgi:cold shock CspA family protein
VDRQLLGTVYAFSSELGLGQILATDERRFGFHATQLADGTRTIEVGASVAFDLAPGRGGLYEAVRVTRIRPTASGSSGSFPCPVCGAHVDGDARDYEICAACGWEDDPVQFDDPSWSGANRISLNEARIQWKRHELQLPE